MTRLDRLIVVALLALWPVTVQGQASRIISSGTLPATCTVGNIYLKTGTAAGFYTCDATDTWSGPYPTTAGGGGDRAFGITIDGGGSDVATGVAGFIPIPFSGTITAATLLSTDASATACSIVIDVWVDVFANYPPTDADSITDSTPPTLSSAATSEDTTLTGWSTMVSTGDVVGFNVDSVTGCTRVTLMLTVQE